ncbi:putative beta-1,4-galactosyltransferase 2-like [Apostichopus japonicus]|uniref:Putative beta-1,4-galactosyltransferase 2-like n=1 Tax=Stichopus japonicus TaxID=307972 RepID=A0A2G8JMC6_STIJA|nr:putative beta-1,4-galactosyltransferase 2-like [Apostichopus japonicus]
MDVYGRSYHPAPFSLSGDGQRQLRSLERLLLPAEAAGLFVVEPADTRQATTETPPPLPQGCYAFSKDAPQVCRELDIPSLGKFYLTNTFYAVLVVGERKPNSEDRSLEKAVEVIFGTNQSAIRAAVARTNQKLTKYLGNSKNRSREVLDDLIVSAESSLIDNYNYLPGGHWIPSTCLPRWKVAIIIPFRNRSHHLPVLLHHLIPFLQRQRLEFGIYVVEQANNLNFNRAMLMNIGFLESLNFTKWDCFIFHDVDHLPKNDRNYYGCSGMPRHFLSGSDRWKYK